MKAVVLMAYGSPERLADVPAYYSDIRGGRPIRPELLEDLVERYRRLGIDEGSPLNAITEETRAALEAELGDVPVFTGMKHWTPRIAEAADAAVSAGADTVVGLVLAPHYSAMSIAGYRTQLEQALDGRAELAFIDSWHDEPGFVELLADRVRGTGAHVVFTAHSLPARILEAGDPYKDQLLETSRLIAERAGLDDWSFSFQSESQTGEPWLGPDILDHLEELHERGITEVLVCPVGFVADHLEIRWDLDHEAAEKARELGLELQPDRDAERRPGVHRGARRAGATGARGTLGSVIRPGEIETEHASRHFKVYPREARRLKDAIVARGRSKPAQVVALEDVSFRVEPGSAIGLVGRNGSGKTTLLRLLSGIIKPTSGRVEVGGRVGSLLELGAGFHPDLTGRENVFLNGSIHGLTRAYVREQLDEIVAFAGLEEFIDLPVRTYSSGMYMRLGFAIAAHIDADVLLLDEVFAVGDEQFQRKCFGKIFEFKQGGGTIVFVSHDASAVERLCDRAVLLRDGRVEFDGTTHDAIVRYRQLLAGDVDPAERGAGLKEWGSGDARIEGVELIGPDGAARTQFLAGEPLMLRLRITAARPLPAPRLSLELRDSSGLLVTGSGRSTGDLGWDEATTELAARFEVDQLPLADGRFHLRLGLTDESGERLYHWLDEALTFVVYPAGDERGVVRMEGRWTGEEIGAQAERIPT